MSIAVSEVYEAFKAAGVPDDKAMAAARAVIPGEHLATLVTKTDLKADLAELKTTLIMWMVSTQIAQLVALAALLRFVVRS